MRRLRVLLLLGAILLGVVVVAEGARPLLASAEGATDPGAYCGTAPLAAGVAAGAAGGGGFFTGYGAYQPRTHCMVTADGRTDWPWVGAMLALNTAVITGYLRIFIFWRRSYLSEARPDRNNKLMDLAWIFLWCAVCGYLGSIAMFFWPGYRAVALCLVPLVFFTWRFAFNLTDFRVALQAKRLQRELTEALIRRNEELEQAVVERTAELEVARFEADRANRAKSHFLANMSHEIRTPMTAILGFVDLLGSPDTNDEERAHHASIVNRNGRHLIAVINDILDLSKIEAGELQIESVACNPAGVAREVVELHRPRAQAKGLELSLELDGPAPIAGVTDPTRLHQIVGNLVGNAVKFTDQGSVRVLLGCESRGEDAVFIVRVEDTGPGLDDEQRVYIFDAFRQADASTTRLHGGTGLGLAIARRLAVALGGDVTVTSAAGCGASFVASVTLGPATGVVTVGSMSGVPGATNDAHAGTTGGSLHARVLLVEDGEDNRRLALHHLTRAGAQVAWADNGRDGVDLALAALAEGRPFDLILMDMHMPRLDGYEATAELRRRGYTGPIIALTASAMRGDRERCLAAGCDDYVSKPFEAAGLRRACVRAVSSARAA